MRAHLYLSYHLIYVPWIKRVLITNQLSGIQNWYQHQFICIWFEQFKKRFEIRYFSHVSNLRENNQFRLIYVVFCSSPTVCPKSLDPFYIVKYSIKWVKTSGTYIHHLQFKNIKRCNGCSINVSNRCNEARLYRGLLWFWLTLIPLVPCVSIERLRKSNL